MKPTAVAAAALVLMPALAGCASHPAPYAGQPDVMAAGAYPQIAVQGGELSKGLFFGPALVTPGTDLRPLSIVQPARNREDYTVNVQYRFEFFDAQRRPLRTNDSWRFMAMPPKVEVFLEGASLETSAVDWRLIVRAAE